MNNKDLKTKLSNHIGYVSINRPPNNHFDAELISQIADFLEEMDKENDFIFRRKTFLCWG